MQAQVYYNDAVVLDSVRNDFLRLRDMMFQYVGIAVDIIESIKREEEVVYELLQAYKYKNELPKIGTVQRLDEFSLPGNDQSINNEYYESLKNYIELSQPIKFEPIIGPNKQSNRNSSEVLYSIPNYPSIDPRRTGRIIRIGPRTIINPTILRFMVMNAGNFGFVHYGPYDPTIWYWRGDIDPYYYTPEQVAGYMNSELSYLLP